MTTTFDPTKPCRTRDGREVEILRTDLRSDKPILAVIRNPAGDLPHTFYSDGRRFLSACDSDSDLVNTAPTAEDEFHERRDQDRGTPELEGHPVLTRRKSSAPAPAPGPAHPITPTAKDERVARFWPEGISDGLVTPCGHCGNTTWFDYRVGDEFWRAVVPDRLRRGVVCLPCLATMADPDALATALEQVQFTAPGLTVVLWPERVVRWEAGPCIISDEPADARLSADSAARAEEREACAQIARQAYEDAGWHPASRNAAAVIADRISGRRPEGASTRETAPAPQRLRARRGRDAGALGADHPVVAGCREQGWRYCARHRDVRPQSP